MLQYLLQLQQMVQTTGFEPVRSQAWWSFSIKLHVIANMIWFRAIYLPVGPALFLLSYVRI